MVAPLGGTLVLFDSVAVPHEVLPTLRGERLALAGWFHEACQDCPDWYGNALCASPRGAHRVCTPCYPQRQRGNCKVQCHGADSRCRV